MRLEIASHKATKFACMNFHYAKRVPATSFGYSVFENNQWCGVILFNTGINNIEKPFSLEKGQVVELARVALNGKQSVTSKAVSLSLKVLKKHAPLVKLVVSYADSYEGHLGVLYQACNWYFIGAKKTVPKWRCKKTGAEVHNRNVDKKGWNIQFRKKVKCKTPSELIKVNSGVKYKYIYPLDKKIIPMCKEMSLPYPKAHEAEETRRPASSREKGGSSPTRALKN